MMIYYFKKPTQCHTRFSSREFSSAMVTGTTEGSAGYFSAAALSKPVIFLPNFNTKKHLPKNFLTYNPIETETSLNKEAIWLYAELFLGISMSWFVVVHSGLWWFNVMVHGGLWWFVVVCGGS